MNNSCFIKYFVFAFLTLLFFSTTQNVVATTYYVSNSGNDQNPGTSTSLPWKSLSKLNSLYKFYPGDSILFKRGDSWIGNLRINNSGTEGNPIHIGTYGAGEKPRFYGSEQISGWSIYKGSIYKASQPQAINQVFVNNERQKAARYPDSGYFNITSVNSSTGFSCSNIKTDINYSGATWIGRTVPYAMVTMNVSYSFGQNLYLSATPFSNLNNNDGFILVGKLEFLDSPGEWFYDATSKTVYLWTANGDSPENYEIRGSVYDFGISLSGKKYIEIKDLEILQNEEGGIYLNNCTGITIENNDISFPDAKGIFATGLNNNLKIANNKIKGANHIGIECFGTNSVLHDNQISDIALFENLGLSGIGTWYMGSGLYIEGNDNIVKYNRISNTGSSGIQFHKKNTIEYNFIQNVLLTKDDGAGIYCSSANSYPNPLTAGSVIRHNIIDGVWGSLDGYSYYGFRQGFGVYLDENAGGVLVENNTISNCTAGCVGLHKSFRETIRNNTLFNSNALISINTDLGGSQIKNNKVYALGKSFDKNENQYLVGKYRGNVSLDSNTYVNHYASTGIFRLENSMRLSFEQWKITTGQDTKSSINTTPHTSGTSEILLYNPTKKDRVFNLGKSLYTDISGNNLTGTLTIKPFMSVIVIGKNLADINEKPTINDQSSNFESPKSKGTFLSTIEGIDPDKGQILTYSIIGGNDMNWFEIDPISGNIFAKNEIQTSKDATVELLVSAADNSVNSLSDTARIVFHIIGKDTKLPEILSFELPEIHNNLNVPVLSFSAADDIAVSGYKLSLTNTLSLTEQVANWSITPPKSFSFTNVGKNIIYAWVRDSSGNISKAVADTVVISLPDLSPVHSTFSFEETEGRTVFDSLKKNSGNIVNNFERISGPAGNALDFNGSGYVNFGDIYGENTQNEITLIAWVKPKPGTDTNHTIISHAGINNNTFNLNLHPSTYGISFEINGLTNSYIYIPTIEKLWDGDWHQLAVVYNGSDIILFFDSSPILKKISTGNIQPGAGYNLLVGATENNSQLTNYFRGSIDEFKIFNYAVSFEEIKNQFHRVNRIYRKINLTENISVCNGENYLGWTKPGIYERILKRKLYVESEPDSIVTTFLTVNPKYYTRDSISIKEGSSYYFGTQTLHVPGNYTETFKSTTGCDSVVALTLSVIPSIVLYDTVKICSNKVYIFGDQPVSTPGNYTKTFETEFGADSIVNLHLVVMPVSNSQEYIVIEPGSQYQGYDTPGTYQRTLFSASGCDSIVTTVLSYREYHYQEIDLKAGWNIFSTFLNPEPAAIDSVFQNLNNQGSLLKLVNEENYIFEKQENGNWINQIGKLQFSEGYKVKVAENCKLTVRGEKIHLPVNIPIKEGVNIISFPSEIPADALIIINPLIENGVLDKLQDEKGKSIEKWGDFGWINNIGSLIPGEGYILQSKKSGLLVIQQIAEKSALENAAISAGSEPQYFSPVSNGNGFDHMNINIVDLNESQLNVGDEIAVFDQNICVAAIKLTLDQLNRNLVSIPITASENHQKNGFFDGDSIQLKIWNQANGMEKNSKAEVIYGKLTFERQSSVFIKVEKIVHSADKINVYPIPANKELYVQFYESPAPDSEINLYDLNGKKILSKHVNTNIETINLEPLRGGVYLIEEVSRKATLTRKIIVTGH